jgi:hypothetical protein
MEAGIETKRTYPVQNRLGAVVLHEIAGVRDSILGMRCDPPSYILDGVVVFVVAVDRRKETRVDEGNDLKTDWL